MNKQSLLICNYNVIYDIFYELKDKVNFKIECITHQEILEKKYDPIDLVISKTNLNIENQLKLHVKKTLTPFKYPRWFEFVSSLPKTATGKIQRFKLRTSK